MYMYKRMFLRMQESYRLSEQQSLLLARTRATVSLVCAHVC